MDSDSFSHSWAANFLRRHKEWRAKWGLWLLIVTVSSLIAGLWLQYCAIEWESAKTGHRDWVFFLSWLAGVAGNMFCGALVAFVGLALYYSKPGDSAEEDQHTFEEQLRTSLSSINASLEGMKHLDIRMLDLGTDIAVFAGFEGILVAYNAPLIWEKKFPERALFTHIMRYKDPKFRNAEYCYPILGCRFVSPTHMHEWNQRIHAFFSLLENVRRIPTAELNHLKDSIERGDLMAPDPMRAACRQSSTKALLDKLQLKDEELAKMSFFLPPRENGEFKTVDTNHGMTFFMGRRYGKRQVIYYQVNPLFLSGIDPKHAILIREPEFCHSVESFHRSCKQGEILDAKPLSLKEFLDTLEQIDPKLPPRNQGT